MRIAHIDIPRQHACRIQIAQPHACHGCAVNGQTVCIHFVCPVVVAYQGIVKNIGGFGILIVSKRYVSGHHVGQLIVYVYRW